MRCLGCMKEIPDGQKICGLCGYDQSAPAKEPYHIIPGTVIGERYLIGRVLGYGGFGVTYIGYDSVLDHTVAVKEYLPGEFSTRMPGDLKITVYSGEKHEQFMSGKEKFLDEARRLAKFRNTEGIVEIYDVFELNDTSYIIMEYLEGETIRSRIEHEGVFTPDEAAKLMKPVMKALSAVHAEGIIHRDIAPDNIYILSDGRVKILDFGAARYASTNFSKSLSVILKQGYAPEEQYRSRGAQGEWSDVYALAATIYKMITGATPEDAIERTVNDELLPPSKLGVKLSANYENALMNALNVYREDRTQTVKDFMDELFSTGEVVRRAGKLHKTDIGKWKRWQKIAVACCGGAAVCVALLFFTGVIDLNSKNKLDGSVTVLSRNEIYVPDLLGKNVSEAAEITDENGVSFRVVDKQYSMNVSEDLIMLQDPGAGAVGDKSELMMNVVVSGGKPIVEIDNYLGKDADEVKKKLEAEGIIVELAEEKSSLANGTVIRQSIEDGTLLRAGNTIKLTVAKNDSVYDTSVSHAIGNYIGAKADDISGVELSDKYTYELVTEYNDSVEKNVIFAQDPEPGTVLAEGTKIVLKVSKGAELVTVPDVQYKSRAEAVKLIESVGAKAEIKLEDSSVVAADHVTRQTTEAGSKVKRGSVITIYVSRGTPDEQESGAEVEAEPVYDDGPEDTPAPVEAPAEPEVPAATTPKKTEPVRTAASRPAATTPVQTEKATQPTEYRGVKLGDNIYAEIVDGDLIISGSGRMYDFTEDAPPPLGAAEDVIFDEGITYIGNYAFHDADISGKVILSNTVQTIGYGAFSGSRLTAFISYSGLKEIGYCAFYGCERLETVRLPYGTNYSSEEGIHSYIFDTIEESQVMITN